MRRRTAAAAIAVYYRMLRALYRPHFLQVRHSFSSLSTKSLILESSSPVPLSSSEHEIREKHIALSPGSISQIVESVISRNSHLWDRKEEVIPQSSSLKDLLLKVFDYSPATVRRFLRVSELNPEDVLEILLGIQFACKNPAIGPTNVGTLWAIFKWASDQRRDFKHLPRSCEVMAQMLVQVGFLREVEFLLSAAESRGILLDSHEIFDNLIQMYVSHSELERAISMYNEMRVRGFIPSLLCYRVLLGLLDQGNESELALRVYLDMTEQGFSITDTEMAIFENIISLYCGDGKIQQSRDAVKRVIRLGLKPSNMVLNRIASEYCRRNDLEDILSFYSDISCSPDILAGNKIIHHLCSSFGLESAEVFMEELLQLGFCPDAITFGILIGWSCRVGKLKNAFIYLTEILSRNLKPDLHSYNAIISGLFKEGVWKHAREIIHEMVDTGMHPNLSTYRVLLAGYCKTRQFDEAKLMVGEMVNQGLVPPSSIKDPLSTVFLSLGLDPLAIRVKRDNGMGLLKTEFVDNLGNGLYLDTDLGEFEKALSTILEDSMVVDFNLLLIRESDQGNIQAAISMLGVLSQWGQELSLQALTSLVPRLAESSSSRILITILQEVTWLIYQLGGETLNLVVQACCQQGFTSKGRAVLKRMSEKQVVVQNVTYTALIMGICRTASLRDYSDCCNFVCQNNWLPSLKEFRVLVGILCGQKKLKEALELFGTLIETNHHLISDFFRILHEELCVSGYTTTACDLAEELAKDANLNHRMYSNAIRGFLKERRFSEAFIIYDCMLSKTLTPCLDVTLLLIPQLCRADKVEKAVALKDSLLTSQPLVASSVRSALVNGFCKAARVGEAVDILQFMLSKGVPLDGDICEMLVLGHCKVNNLREVQELLGVMMRKKFSLSFPSYRNMVNLMCRNSKVLSALSLKEVMLRENNFHIISIYNILIFYLLSSRNSLHVDKVIQEMQEKEVLFNEITYNYLVFGFHFCKNVSKSSEYITTMMAKGLWPSSRALRAAICSLSDAGDFDRAMDLSLAMELRGCIHGAAVQHAVVEGLLCHCKIQEAEDFLNRMAIKDLIPRNINYDHLIKRFCWYGRLNKAVDLVNIMLQKGSIPNSTSYDCLIHGFCLNNKIDQAADFCFEMLHKNLRPDINTWNVLVGKFCERGRTAEAEGFLTSMVHLNETPSREMYHSLINRYRLENNFSKASELLQAMQKKGYEPDFETHWSLISKLRDVKGRDNGNSTQGFLSRLLSRTPDFQGKHVNKAKPG